MHEAISFQIEGMRLPGDQLPEPLAFVKTIRVACSYQAVRRQRVVVHYVVVHYVGEHHCHGPSVG